MLYRRYSAGIITVITALSTLSGGWGKSRVVPLVGSFGENVENNFTMLYNFCLLLTHSLHISNCIYKARSGEKDSSDYKRAGKQTAKDSRD